MLQMLYNGYVFYFLENIDEVKEIDSSSRHGICDIVALFF